MMKNIIMKIIEEEKPKTMSERKTMTNNEIVMNERRMTILMKYEKNDQWY